MLSSMLHKDMKAKGEGDDTGPWDLNSRQDKIEVTGPKVVDVSLGIGEAKSEEEWSFVDLYK